MTDSNTPPNETRQQVRERERQEVRARVRKWKRERRRKRLKRLAPFLAVLVVLVFVLVQAGGDTPESSDAVGGTTSPSPGSTAATPITLAARQVRYISEDGTQLADDVSLVTLWESELRITSNAFNGLTSALGLPDQLGNEDTRRVGSWLLAGGGTLEILEGASITIFCGPENVIAANVGDGVILCRSTLEEANAQAAEGMGAFQFIPDPTTSGPGDWTSCDSDVATAKARLEFRVNATADDAGSSANEAAPTDIINGLKLSACGV